MEFKVGMLVTRKSYNNDVIFKIIRIDNNIYKLKGLNIRLVADSIKEDLNIYLGNDIENKEFEEGIKPDVILNRNDYFYIPGKILHIDSDIDYLNRCLKFYKENLIKAYGINLIESDIPLNINKYLHEYNPNILVITGHDAYYKNKQNNIDNYKNSKYFIDAVKEARKYEKNHDKLIIIAGACQSNYEELIKAGANFASSPKRINIHALDPAIVASSISLSDVNKNIDLKKIIDKTKYGKDGIGGIFTKGTMYMGYPR